MNSANMENNSDISKTLGIDSSPSRSRRLARWLGWSLPLIAGAVLAAGWLSNDGADTVQYTTQPAVRDSLTVTVTATGNLEPTNEVEVGSELSGTVKTVEVDYNDHVKTGQVLARLDTSKLQAQVMQSKASLAAAQAKVLDARATIKEAKSELARLEHLRGLSGEKAVSRHDMDAAEATLARAVAGQSYYEAEVSRTKAVLEANETDLSKAVIRSTVNGIVLNRSVEPGQTVAASLETPVLFKLAEDLSKMKLHVSVDEADVGDVRDGQEATFAVDAYRGRRFPAHITQVRYGPEEDEDESSDDDGVVTYIAVLNVDNSDLSLRPGMTATAEIVVQKLEGAVLVPNAALRFSPPEEVKQTGSQKSGIMSKLLPRPPAPTQSNKTEQQNDADRRARVWTLRDGLPAPISVKTGSTDGTRTVILEGAVEPGTALIVDRVSATP